MLWVSRVLESMCLFCIWAISESGERYSRYVFDSFNLCVCVSMCTYMRVCKCAREREKREKMCIDTLFRKKASDPLMLDIYTTMSPQAGAGGCVVGE